MGFTSVAGTYDTNTGAITIDFGVPGGATGSSNFTGTVTPPGEPTTASGTLTANYTLDCGLQCRGYNLSFTNVTIGVTGTWNATGSNGCGYFGEE